jgi:hypothetical protein
VPLRLTTDLLPLAELLEMVIVPLAEPPTVGTKLTCRLAVCPGFSVTGNAPPDSLKLAPVSVAELTVSGAVPEEVSVSVWLAVAFRATFPNARVLPLSVS